MLLFPLRNSIEELWAESPAPGHMEELHSLDNFAILKLVFPAYGEGKLRFITCIFQVKSVVEFNPELIKHFLMYFLD